MSRHFWAALTVIFAGFGAYEGWQNLHLRSMHNNALRHLAVCKPDPEQPKRQMQASL